ncbi:MAG: site-specific integrase [Tyzzerella sp.]|nr:site-specific integrase [Tyzzerella sp.]
MPCYKDEKTGTYYVKFYYTDINGTKKQKLKRGFKLQREAKDWERNFLETRALDVNVKFKNFLEQYYKDAESRLRRSTLENKKTLINLKILPYFQDMTLSEIRPVHVRQWQNTLLSYTDENGKPYSQTYLKTINNQLSAIFNYAVKYYDLKENPCHKAGSMGKKHAEEMQIWTFDEFQKFIQEASDKPVSYAAFNILYYTGIRVGELLALTWKDIDLDNNTISINKSYQRIKGEDVITKPKTPKSTRAIVIFDYLSDIIRDYKSKIYKPHVNDRVFEHTKHYFTHELKRICQKAEVKKIRVHDLRHSHASLLIELGFSPLLIAERLGHENIETTLNTYSHLYPNKQVELADKLQILVSN